MKRRGRTRTTIAKLLSEPLVHFVALGLLLFLANRWVGGDARTIALSRGVKADLDRRFKDRNHGRAPTPAELAHEIREWQRDEALYREALRERLDRTDSTVRAVLADRIRARVALEIPTREPSAGDLDVWLAAHRDRYEEPRRYEYESIAFSKSAPAAPAGIDKTQRALELGAEARSLGKPIVGATLTEAELRERLGPVLAARVESLPMGIWQRVAGDDTQLLVRLVSVSGGLPEKNELRRRMLVDWQYDDHQRRTEEALNAIVSRYRMEERP